MNITHSPRGQTRTIRIIVPADLHSVIRHLALDLHRPLADLGVEALLLLARYHGKGADLPEPTRPLTVAEVNGGSR